MSLQKIDPSNVYSGAVVHENRVYVSGQLALDKSKKDKTLVGAGDTALEADQVLKNLQAQLVSAGSSLKKVIKTDCFLADINDYSAFNAVYVKYFSKTGLAACEPPARVCLQVAALPLGAKVEVSCMAAL
eukprot:g2504.t1